MTRTINTPDGLKLVLDDQTRLTRDVLANTLSELEPIRLAACEQLGKLVAYEIIEAYQNKSKGATFDAWCAGKDMRAILGMRRITSLRKQMRQLGLGASDLALLVHPHLKAEYPDHTQQALHGVHGLQEWDPLLLMFSSTR